MDSGVFPKEQIPRGYSYGDATAKRLGGTKKWSYFWRKCVKNACKKIYRTYNVGVAVNTQSRATTSLELIPTQFYLLGTTLSADRAIPSALEAVSALKGLLSCQSAPGRGCRDSARVPQHLTQNLLRTNQLQACLALFICLPLASP